MPTFPHQKANKSRYQQHAVSYNPTSPQPITLHGEHVSNHEADENPSHTERQAKKKRVKGQKVCPESRIFTD